MTALIFMLMLATPWQDAAPVISETERLRVQVIAQRLEIAQLKALAAQAEFDKARDDFNKLILTLQKDGYTLNLEKLEYTKKAAAKENK